MALEEGEFAESRAVRERRTHQSESQSIEEDGEEEKGGRATHRCFGPSASPGFRFEEAL